MLSLLLKSKYMGADMREFELQDLKQQVSNGANWFYWIAGLSLINALVLLGGGAVHFIVGSSFVELCGTMAKDGIAILGYPGAVIILAFYAYLGKTANRPLKWPFIAGMIIYTLDGLLYLVVADFLPALFHLYVLYKLYTGYTAVTPFLNLQNDLNTNPIQIQQEPTSLDTAPAGQE